MCLIINYTKRSPFWRIESCLASWEIPAFYGSRMFSTVFTRARHSTQFWDRWIHCSLPHHFFLRSILLITFHLYLSFPNGFCLLYFPVKISYTFLIRQACFLSLPSPPSFDRRNNIGWMVQIMKALIMYDTQYVKNQFETRHIAFKPTWRKTLEKFIRWWKIRKAEVKKKS